MAARGCLELSVYVYIRLTHIQMQHTLLNSIYTASSSSPLKIIGNIYQESSTKMYGGRAAVIKTKREEGENI